ncbi:MAG: hypothetical protein RI560_09895, partial [Natronomonas sp.]|nr:hypothetical protein [Natronomonas sp.]
MARRVTDGVTLLEIAWPEPIGANAYLVDDGEVTLVDAGVPLPRRSLTGQIRAAGYAVSEIDHTPPRLSNAARATKRSAMITKNT